MKIENGKAYLSRIDLDHVLGHGSFNRDSPPSDEFVYGLGCEAHMSGHPVILPENFLREYNVTEIVINLGDH